MAMKDCEFQKRQQYTHSEIKYIRLGFHLGLIKYQNGNIGGYGIAQHSGFLSTVYDNEDEYDSMRTKDDKKLSEIFAEGIT